MTQTNLSEIRPVIIADDGYCEVEYTDTSHEDAASEYVRSGDWNIDEVGHCEVIIWTWEPEWLDDDGFERNGFEKVPNVRRTEDFF